MVKKPSKSTRKPPSGGRKPTKSRATSTKSTKDKEPQNGTETKPAVIEGEHDTFVTLKKKLAMLKALKFFHAIVTPACDAVGIARKTHYRWMEDDAGYREEVLALQEGTFDFVETKMIERINAGSDTMLIWYSKTKMKNRGFVERTEIEVTNKPAFVVNEDHKGVRKVMDVIHKADKTGT